MIFSGHAWHAYSPSLFELASHPRVTLGYNGAAWYLGFDGAYNGAQPWPSRDAAAAAIAQAFIDHQLQEQQR
jgi:hypothetical protein